MRTILLCLAIVCLFTVPVSAETLILSSESINGIYSSPLTAGQLYEFTVAGTYVYGNTPDAIADAEWSNASNWMEVGTGYSLATDVLDVVMDDTPVDWLGTSDGVTYTPHTFSPTHTYIYRYVGTGSRVNFHVADLFPWGGDCTGDNRESLTLVITPVPEPSGLITLLCGVVGIGTTALRTWKTRA